MVGGKAVYVRTDKSIFPHFFENAFENHNKEDERFKKSQDMFFDRCTIDIADYEESMKKKVKQHTDWQGYVQKAKEVDSEIVSVLEDNLELLVFVESELNKARVSLPAMLCLSNEDMDPKNIMWDNGTPWVIDLECLDYGNPVSHAMQLALQWSGIVTCNMDVDKMIAFFDGYLEAYDNCFRGYSDVVGVVYTWIEWLEYNIQRALGKCMDEEERKLGISEVRNTIDRIQYIRKMMPRIREALNTHFGM